jgi:hypothetical protein
MHQAVEKFLSEKLEKEPTTLLSKDKSRRRIFPVDQLERFAIQVGFWIFGGMSLQMAGEDRKVIGWRTPR